MPEVCAFEAKMALFAAAGRAATARERHDEVALALWRGHADAARDWLRLTLGDEDVTKSEVAA